MCPARSTLSAAVAGHSGHEVSALTSPNTHTHIQVLSGCEEVGNCPAQLVEPYNLPQPRNTTLQHEFYLTATQMLEYTPTQRLPTRLPYRLVKIQ